jgi:hypothetical protein
MSRGTSTYALTPESSEVMKLRRILFTVGAHSEARLSEEYLCPQKMQEAVGFFKIERSCMGRRMISNFKN